MQLQHDKHSAWSSLREEYVEYTFLGELCREFWRRDIPVDVLRAHTDQGGFDVVLETGALQRHVQIKSSFTGSATKVQKINRKLEQKIGGCVIWVLFDPGSLEIDHYRWFGDKDPTAATPCLGERLAKHTKANSQGVKSIRPGIRTLVWGDFARVETTSELASFLFPLNVLAPTSGEDLTI
jgi:hypothetical protein